VTFNLFGFLITINKIDGEKEYAMILNDLANIKKKKTIKKFMKAVLKECPETREHNIIPAIKCLRRIIEEKTGRPLDLIVAKEVVEEYIKALWRRRINRPCKTGIR
jgi:hypothetical protein